MKRSVQVYVEGERLELFNDENIAVSSSVQNISDISKVFTDFSQSFTVPASTVNNRIFEHFYNSDLDGTINHNLRRNANIEIDLIPFRKGKLQLEKSNLKDGKPSNYTVTFYGDVRTLKDAFGTFKLSNLDYSAFSFLYSGDEIQERIENNLDDYDLKFPFISSYRLWQYNEPTTPLDNIDTVTGAVNYFELYPALRISEIFRIIEQTFGVTFTGLFLNSQQFKKAFLYCKNKEAFKLLTDAQIVDLTYQWGDSYPYEPFNLLNDSLILQYRQDVYNLIGNAYPYVYQTHTISINVVVNDPTIIYFVDIYRNGIFYSTYSSSGNQSAAIYTTSDVLGLYEVFTFKIRSENVININITFDYLFEVVYQLDDGTGTLQNQYYSSLDHAINTTQTLTAILNIANYMPDMKIEDFFRGVLQEFNLTCYGIADNTYQIEPLEDWYNKGTIYDVTKYTTIENIDIERIKLYKRIAFEYQQSQSFMNKQFKTFFEREYGNLFLDFPYDGGDFVTQLPFENLMFNKFTDTDIQVGYCLTPFPDFKPYVPKPIILYFNEYSYDKVYYRKETTTVDLYRQARFGQDLIVSNTNYSLNWGEDTSTFYQIPILNSLYKTYYSKYLENLFNLKNRLTKIRCILPLSILTGLKLNDRIVIRDKRYIINEMNSELTSGIVNFTLINDFRPVRRTKPAKGDKVTGLGYALVSTSILIPNKCLYAEIDITGTDIIAVDFTTVYEDTNVTFTIPEVPAINGRVTEDSIYTRITESTTQRITEEAKVVSYGAKVTYYFENDYTEIDYILIIQE